MRICLLVSLLAAMAAPAAAQERPFLLSLGTTRDTKPAVRVDYDAGIGERAFQSDVATRPEQRVGVQASRGRLTFVARVGLATTGSSYQSSQSGEVLYSFSAPARGLALAAGGGVLHEAGGVNVLLARLVAGHSAELWNLQGNLLLQKPISSERDAIDLITSVGWSRKLPAASRWASKRSARTSKDSGNRRKRKEARGCSRDPAFVSLPTDAAGS
jgi:hypothetical protein